MNLIKIKVGEDTKIFMVKKVTVTLGKTWGIINLYFFSESGSGEGDMLELVVTVDEVSILLDGIGSGRLFDMDGCGASIERSTFYTHVSGYIRADKVEELGGKFYDKDMQLYSLDDTNCDFSSIPIQSSDSTTGVTKSAPVFTCMHKYSSVFGNYVDEESVCDVCCYKDKKQECEGCQINPNRIEQMHDNKEHTYCNIGIGGDALESSLYAFGGDTEDTDDKQSEEITEKQPEDITEITHSIPDENNHKELSDEELESTILPWGK